MLLGIPRPFELDPLLLTYPTGMLCDVAELFMSFFVFCFGWGEGGVGFGQLFEDTFETP